MAPIWSRQPFKAAYIGFVLVKLPITLLFSLRYIFRPLRIVKDWGYKACFIRDILHVVLDYATSTRFTGYENVLSEHVKAKDRASKAEPGNNDIYTGVLTPKATVPAEVGGIWYPSNPAREGKTLDEAKVVLHFPGGAFVLAAGYDSIGRDIADTVFQSMNASYLFYAQYRTAQTPETRFPAAVQDVVTLYQHVLDLGFKAHNIIISGDSAAGNLIVALVRYLGIHPVLPVPSGVMCWSPWLHVTPQAGQDYEKCANSGNDILTSRLLQWGAEAYFPASGPSEEELPYISPLHHPFKTSVPFFFHAGKAEAFYDWVKEFAKEMADMNGEDKTRFHETELAPHNLLMGHKGYELSPQMMMAGEDARQFFKW